MPIGRVAPIALEAAAGEANKSIYLVMVILYFLALFYLACMGLAPLLGPALLLGAVGYAFFIFFKGIAFLITTPPVWFWPIFAILAYFVWVVRGSSEIKEREE